ncbi:uncharacterized protein ATNIH1004_002072 [Aspergillus tanneri]|uniref:Zn(2)-C6 fungal-type domain-containing protein n=1 Tax=Aspergillus tanneri TaxID=1220188 RepID=A0A5M9M3K5_9EURO|nr:uncharacterized protein ATNIH1004_002072 [Aspergillus tanneri]KAA8641271.1 hypothetical protein ATNIH1004_002072 [Aspergillus tanneri]
MLTVQAGWSMLNKSISTMISTTAATEPGERRQCWECRRRRLVCDSSRPACNKCLQPAPVRPGYGSKKPLKWITQGPSSPQSGSTTWIRKRQQFLLPNEASYEQVSAGG